MRSSISADTSATSPRTPSRPTSASAALSACRLGSRYSVFASVPSPTEQARHTPTSSTGGVPDKPRRKKASTTLATYLNSQPRAPTNIGFRGFPRLVFGRYAVALLTVITSIGYKFGVSEVSISTLVALAPEDIVLRLPPVDGFQNGNLSPWFSDTPGGGDNQAFHHTILSNQTAIPRGIFMVGWPDCGDTFGTGDEGELVTKETIMTGAWRPNEP